MKWSESVFHLSVSTRCELRFDSDVRHEMFICSSVSVNLVKDMAAIRNQLKNISSTISQPFSFVLRKAGCLFNGSAINL